MIMECSIIETTHMAWSVGLSASSTAESLKWIQGIALNKLHL